MRSIKYIYAAGTLAAVLLLTPGESEAQNNKPVLKFDAQAWDFGTLREADGPVSHVFTFTNTSSGAIIIERVTTDCGCTAPKYSSEPIRPGRTGSVEIVFDPTNYKGDFTKTASVFCNDGRSRNNLTLTGTVVERERTVEELYPYSLAGGLRADNMSLAFDYMENNTSKSMAVNLVNTSSSPVTLAVGEMEGSGYLEVYVPASIAPGERAAATFTYDLAGEDKPVYGMISDRVKLSVNGTVVEMPISSHAIAIEDFSNLDPLRVASCHLSPVFHNFGRTKPGRKLTREITVTNEGTAPLIIRSINPRSNTVCDLAQGTVIAVGASVKFNVSMTLREGSGIKTGGISLVTNDPERPLREIRLAAELEK